MKNCIEQNECPFTVSTKETRNNSLEKRLAELAKNDFHLILLPYLADVITDEHVPNYIRELRWTALITLQNQLNRLKREGNYVEKLLVGIAAKKSAMIVNATSKAEIKQILNPSGPVFDGNTFKSSAYLTEEEELIAWLKAYEIVPHLRGGYERTKELFTRIFPELEKEVFL